MPLYCSPSKKTHPHINTCYNTQDIKNIAIAFNNYIQSSPICKNNKCIQPTPININQPNTKLYYHLQKQLQTLCKHDFCWIDLDFIKFIQNNNIKHSLLHLTFKPKALKHKSTWLNTRHINHIMQQYQQLYHKNFLFLGAQPSNYTKITHINWHHIKQKPLAAIIFNTDPHYLPGQHWIAIFINNQQKSIDYFDSFAQSPNKNITSFLKHFHNYKFTFNTKIHQQENNNCGVYSCYFIIQRLLGKSFKHITNKIITDNMMTNYRDFLFRPNTS